MRGCGLGEPTVKAAAAGARNREGRLCLRRQVAGWARQQPGITYALRHVVVLTVHAVWCDCMVCAGQSPHVAWAGGPDSSPSIPTSSSLATAAAAAGAAANGPTSNGNRTLPGARSGSRLGQGQGTPVRTVDDGQGDMEAGVYRSEPRPPKAQRRLKQQAAAAAAAAASRDGLHSDPQAVAGDPTSSTPTNTTTGSTPAGSQLELTAAAAAAAGAANTPGQRSRALERDSSSNSLPDTPQSEAHAVKARGSTSPFASLWGWRAKTGAAAATPQLGAPAGGQQEESSVRNTQGDAVDTSSSNSSGGGDDGGMRRRQLLGEQDALKEGRASSPGLLGALRTGVWRNAVQGLGHKGSRSQQSRDQNDRWVHLSPSSNTESEGTLSVLTREVQSENARQSAVSHRTGGLTSHSGCARFSV
jgi:hypothetical protein